MRDWKLLQDLPGEFVGELASEDVAAKARRLLTQPNDNESVGEFLSAWLSSDNHAAFRIKDQMVWTLRVLGKPVVVHWIFYPEGEEPEDADDFATREIRVYAYDKEEDAYQNACKLFFGWVLEHPKTRDFLREMTGWRQDVVMLVHGSDFYVIRTHHNGRIEVSGSEEISLAYGEYAEFAEKLSNEIEFRSELPGLRDSPMYAKIAAAFVKREGGNALRAYARHSLALAIDGATAIAKHGGDKSFNMSKLARSLHTDRPNLIRVQGKSDLADITPEKLREELHGDAQDAGPNHLRGSGCFE